LTSSPFFEFLIRGWHLASSAALGWQAMNATDWLAAYAERLGTPPPTEDELTAVLDLAGEAAHASERIAAPVACWLAARAGVELDEAMRLARDIEPTHPGR
jgi:hypothetical protein